MSGPERIAAAALLVGREVVSLPPPARHADVRRHALVGTPASANEVDVAVEGFLTSTGRFVDRVEGSRVARAARQIGFAGLPLQSTDLW